ncbi:hypothetical protein MNBD_GAMMA22-1486 [hydrothermal vent metagenome]|uniref:DUF72 domain-containing protein n=1 Tax=hydrothermal vent metagenome TaxID=652676 RepID=A0A3B1AIL5_9ZZZZ
MIMANEYKLLIGAYGWQHKAWNEAFYPEDLPEEWQFAYYANEYSVVMIPWKLLQQNFEIFEQGIEDSEESCRILYEMPVNDFKTQSNSTIRDAVQRFLDKVSFVGDRSLGLVLVFQYSDICNLSQDKLDFFRELLQTITKSINLCIEVQAVASTTDSTKPISNDILSILADTNAGLCAYNDCVQKFSDYPEVLATPFNLTVCDIISIEPKKMRKIVENSLRGECAASTNVLIFRSKNLNHEQMNTASVISDLL